MCILSFLSSTMAFSTSFLSLLMVVITLGYATPLTSDPLPQEVYWNNILPTSPMPSVLRRLLHSGIRTPYVLQGERVWHTEGCIVGSYIRQRVEAIWRDHRPEALLTDDAVADDYILYDDLHPGTNITLHVLASTALSGFLPRRVAASVPFSHADLPKILARFSVRSPDSVEAKAIETSLVVCDWLADDTGDRARCATSLESMVDFAVAKMGTTNLTATSTRAMKEMSPEKEEQMYRIVAVRRMGGDKGVVCHPMPYPYAVYYCHLIREPTAMAFAVAAVGEDGTVVDAVAACHMRTSGRNGKHLSVLVLEKPGVLVCHFLSKDNVVWAPAA